jgi:hypothetical protein
MQNSIEAPQKISTIDPAIPLLYIYPKEMKSTLQRYLHIYVYCGLFTIAKIWNQG